MNKQQPSHENYKDLYKYCVKLLYKKNAKIVQYYNKTIQLSFIESILIKNILSTAQRHF